MTDGIFIALGSNLPAPDLPSPLATCQSAVAALIDSGVSIKRQSRWYLSRPLPDSDQPWFVNGVVSIETDGTPELLLADLHRLEASFGRRRRKRWEARILDLDLISFGDRVVLGHGEGLSLPHPRMHQRAFVLRPLAEIAPNWRHPQFGNTVDDLLANCADTQVTVRI